MSANGKFKDFTLDDFIAVADRFGIGKPNLIIDQVRDAIGSWPMLAKEEGVNKKELQHIEKLHLMFSRPRSRTIKAIKVTKSRGKKKQTSRR